MRYKVVTIFYNGNHDDTTVKFSVDFEYEHNCTKLDVLNDAMGLLMEKFEEIKRIEFPEEEKV
jgi:hypothetical protein